MRTRLALRAQCALTRSRALPCFSRLREEICMWAGVWLGTCSSFRGAEHVAVLSPLFVYRLLTRVSGIPLLAKRSMKKWGHLPEFLAHVRKTPLLVPLPLFMQ